MDWFLGIDAGSTYVKAVLIDERGAVKGQGLSATGFSSEIVASQLIDKMCLGLSISPKDLAGVVATGYGRRRIDAAEGSITEIKAHAMGALHSQKTTGEHIGTIIDVGGQDTKVIILSDQGQIEHFVMNDKCAAGTGRFIEHMARILEIPLPEMGELAISAPSPCEINSTCVVFAESEVISLCAGGRELSDVVSGIHYSLARRIARMARGANLKSGVLMTGGGALNRGLVMALEEELMADVHPAAHPQLNGALGAALSALETCMAKEKKGDAR